ncbi:TolC family protein [Chitinophaga nivalis]|uniref:TolC family protein n=1 Tax=Chitinophaga nivalis TaxID=2991709 RepID=A0ABT3ILR2_9BACT|nr:TolC family protein [Chitinophaga nivalis]MCW3465406.1 TolC family protein [Chitinophaga nivalis]MCW3484902.1 TolC family protein [Chitinophaga nivalis]
MKSTSIVSCVLLFSALSTAVNAQVKVAGKTTPQAASAAVPANTQNNIQEKLVELAMNNPRLKAARLERDKTVYELNKANANWLNYVTVGANLNEVSLRMYKGENNNTQNLYYPLWNVGISVPLGSLISKPNDVKIARKNVELATQQQELLSRNVRAVVLSKYQNYLLKKELLTLQNEITEDDYAAFSQAEQKFSTGGITYDEYSISSKRYNAELVKKITLETDLSQAKLDLEEIIGIKLEEALLAASAERR